MNLWILWVLDIISEMITLTYQIGRVTREYGIPALVYIYCFITHYITPAFRIPYYYLKVRNQRMSTNTYWQTT